MDFFETVKGLLLNPTDTFDDLEYDTMEDAIKYCGVIVAIFGLLFSITYFIRETFAIFVIVLMMCILIGTFIVGFIFYIVGGRNGIEQTIKVVMYSLTPFLLLSWLPIIGIFAGLWSLLLEIIGIRHFHDLTTGRLVIATILSLVILIIIALYFIAVVFAMYMGGYLTPFY